jgi:hypothetical protein
VELVLEPNANSAARIAPGDRQARNPGRRSEVEDIVGERKRLKNPGVKFTMDPKQQGR